MHLRRMKENRRYRKQWKKDQKTIKQMRQEKRSESQILLQQIRRWRRSPPE